jgi:hypothetical protein
MALTKDFADTVRARAHRDAGFRRELLRGAIEAFLESDVGTGKIVLRDYINATIGFERLAAGTADRRQPDREVTPQGEDLEP